MDVHNPLTDPLFLPALKIIGLLFAFGLGLVLFFARKDLEAGLRGELGQRYLAWMVMAPLLLVAVFVGQWVAAVILLIFFFRLAVEYVRVVGVERPYAIFLYALIPITFTVAAITPSLYFALPAGAILLLTLVPILTGRVEELYDQLSFAGRGYLYLVWSIGHLILHRQLGGVGMILLVGIGIASAARRAAKPVARSGGECNSFAQLLAVLFGNRWSGIGSPLVVR